MPSIQDAIARSPGLPGTVAAVRTVTATRYVHAAARGRLAAGAGRGRRRRALRAQVPRRRPGRRRRSSPSSSPESSPARPACPCPRSCSSTSIRSSAAPSPTRRSRSCSPRAPGPNVGLDFLPGALAFDPAAGPAARPGARRRDRLARRVGHECRPHAEEHEPAPLARPPVADRPRRGAVLPPRLAGPAGRARGRRSRRSGSMCCCRFAGTIAEADARLAPRMHRTLLARDPRARAGRLARWREHGSPATYLVPLRLRRRRAASQPRSSRRRACRALARFSTRSSASCRASSAASSSTPALIFCRAAGLPRRAYRARRDARARARVRRRPRGAARSPERSRAIAAGDPSGGPIAALPAVRALPLAGRAASTIIQTSPVHTGICDDPHAGSIASCARSCADGARIRPWHSRPERNPLTRFSLALLIGLLALAGAACGSDDDEEPSGSAAAPAATAAAADACATDQLELISPGTLTVGTDKPALPTVHQGRRPDQRQGLRERARLRGRRQARRGRQGEVDRGAVELLLCPGAEELRLRHQPDLDQREAGRARGLLQALLHDAAGRAGAEVVGCRVASLADLADAKLGVQIGTTSLDAVTEVIAPSEQPQVFNDSTDIVRALKTRSTRSSRSADRVHPDRDRGFQLEDRRPVRRPGRRRLGPRARKGLQADVPCLDQALDAMTASGELQEITDQWIGGQARAPELPPSPCAASPARRRVRRAHAPPDRGHCRLDGGRARPARRRSS